MAYTIGILLYWSKIEKVYQEGPVYPSWKIRWNHHVKPDLGLIILLGMIAKILRIQSMKRYQNHDKFLMVIQLHFC